MTKHNWGDLEQGSKGLYARLRQQIVTETFDICNYITENRRCMSRKYFSSYEDFTYFNWKQFSRIPQVLGNGECMYCWDKHAGQFYEGNSKKGQQPVIN